MRYLRTALVLLLPLVIGGCAVSTPIESAEDSGSEFDNALIYGGERTQVQDPLPDAELHRVFHRGSTGFTPVSAVRNSAMQRVVEFCQQEGKEPYIVEEATSKPPHILGNWPRAEIVFSCVQVASTSNRLSESEERYDAIRNLKALLDDGAISAEEYEAEKRKLLD